MSEAINATWSQAATAEWCWTTLNSESGQELTMSNVYYTREAKKYMKKKLRSTKLTRSREVQKTGDSSRPIMSNTSLRWKDL